MVFSAWLWFFLPVLLVHFNLGSVGYFVLSAVLFWPLVCWRWSRFLVLSFLLLLGVANFVHIGFYGYLLDEFFLATAQRTNWHEVLEFSYSIAPKIWFLTLAWLLGCVVAVRIVWRFAPHWQQLRWSQARGGLVVCVAAFFVWFLAGIWGVNKQLSAAEFIYSIRPVYPMHFVQAEVRQQKMQDDVFYIPELPKVQPEKAEFETIVLVLGESASASHWSLLGYRGESTNQALLGIDNLSVGRVMAHGPNTAAAFPFLLTGLSALDSVEQRAPSILDLAKNVAGYKTFVFTNSRFNDSQEDFYTQALRRASDVYQKVGDGALDAVLTDAFVSALQDAAPKKLIILHTYGSHPKLELRYPSGEYTSADDYDNSIHYSSDLLAQWIGLTQAHSKDHPALFLYTSDHGLAGPPCAPTYSHANNPESLEVPLLVWRSTAGRAQQASVVEQSANALGQADVWYSNVLVPKMALQAMGLGALAGKAPWNVADHPEHDGLPWAQARKRQFCELV